MYIIRIHYNVHWQHMSLTISVHRQHASLTMSDSQVTTITVIPGPVPTLVDAVIVQLYRVAGVNIPTVSLRAPSVMSFTGSPLPLVGVQTMSYLVIAPFR